MGFNLKIFLIVCSFVYLSARTFGIDLTQKINTYDLQVWHPHGEDYIMDVLQAQETVPNPAKEVSPEIPAKSSNSTSLDCQKIGSCCYQYTWPGIRYDDGNTNFTCDKYAKSSGSKEPCKLPIVFTYQNKTRGTRPNITELVKFADAKDYKIYCVRTNSCIKYSYFEDSSEGDRVLLNETRFCGVVQSVNKKTTIEKGCYTEKIERYTREVCVCSRDRCNTSSTIIPPFPLTLLLDAISLILLQRRY